MGFNFDIKLNNLRFANDIDLLSDIVEDMTRIHKPLREATDKIGLMTNI